MKFSSSLDVVYIFLVGFCITVGLASSPWFTMYTPRLQNTKSRYVRVHSGTPLRRNAHNCSGSIAVMLCSDRSALFMIICLFIYSIRFPCKLQRCQDQLRSFRTFNFGLVVATLKRNCEVWTRSFCDELKVASFLNKQTAVVRRCSYQGRQQKPRREWRRCKHGSRVCRD